jgi:hypothetical protein
MILAGVGNMSRFRDHIALCEHVDSDRAGRSVTDSGSEDDRPPPWHCRAAHLPCSWDDLGRAGQAGRVLVKLAGYLARQVSQFERGIASLTDIAVLGRFAAVLEIAPQALGLAPGDHCRLACPVGEPRRHIRQVSPVFLSSQVNQLAEDKRFELLRVSPTRFPILLMTVRRQPGPCVTRRDGTERTVPATAERPRMRRKLRRTGRRLEGRDARS